MKPETKKQIFTIPNVLTLLRLISVPFFMYFTIINTKNSVLIGFIILIVSASTDLVDGYIARRFNQVSEVGKAFDPVADKIMHCGAILALVIIGYVNWIFFALIILKEVLMLLGGLVLVTNKKIIQANFMGKIASATISVGVLMSFFHPFFADKVFYLDWIILGVGVVLTYVAFYNYATQGIKIYLELKKKK